MVLVTFLLFPVCTRVYLFVTNTSKGRQLCDVLKYTISDFVLTKVEVCIYVTV